MYALIIERFQLCELCEGEIGGWMDGWRFVEFLFFGERIEGVATISFLEID